MNWKLLAIIFLLGSVVACNKDKYNTKPSLSLKSISTHVVPVNGNLIVDFEFTDKEGDVSNKLFLKKIRNNKRQVSTIRDTITLDVPSFPKHLQGVIEANLSYQGYLISAQNPPLTGNPPR